MSDIDGEDAFTLVLDRLIDSQSSLYVEREKRGDAEGELRDVKRKQIETAGNLAFAEGRIEMLIAKAKKLYEAADDIVDFSHAAPDILAEKRAALRAQLESCRSEFFTIPF